MSEADELTLWRRRALRAEGAVFYALSLNATMHFPIGHMQRDGARPEMAYELVRRLREHFDHVYPDLVARYIHQRMAVYELASSCDCPRSDNDWDEEHDETDEHGQWLCAKTLLGYVCITCESEDGDGPDWKPDAVEWPCPPITELNERLTRETT